MVYCISIHQYIIVIPLDSHSPSPAALLAPQRPASARALSCRLVLVSRRSRCCSALATDRSGDLGNLGPVDSQLEVPKHFRKTKWKIKKKHLMSNYFTKILEIREIVEKLSLVDFTNCAFTTQQIQIELDCVCVCLHGYLGY